jgi:hypothetical protein
VTFVPSQTSRVQTLPSSVQVVPFAFFASVGQVADVPVQVSATSHSPAAARQGIPALPAGCWQLVLTPSHLSVVHGLPSSVQAVPLLPAACWHVALVPLHRSVVHGLPSSVHAIPLPFLASVGHVVDVPVHVSATSHSPVAARQVVPALPAGCWHVVADPLHVSVVQGLPSSVHADPLGFGEHVPTRPVRLQAEHSFVHEVSQQTPLTQNPVAHCVFDVHVSANDGS